MNILFELKYSLSTSPQIDLSLNNMAAEQVQVTKLLGATRDGNLSWSKHIDLLAQKTEKHFHS